MDIKSLLVGSFLLLVVSCSYEADKETITPAGYHYTLHTSTEGEQANPGDYVYFHAQTRNGEVVVNSSRESGNGVTPYLQLKDQSSGIGPVSPVQELLAIMKIGDSSTIFLPLDTLISDQKPVGFKDAEVMMYDLVMLDIKTPEEFQQLQKEKQKDFEERKKSLQSRGPEAEKLLFADLERYRAGTLKDHLIETESGLKVFFHKKTDAHKPKTGDKVSVNYVGSLMSGQVFNNSFNSGVPFEFVMGEGRVIEGWESIFHEVSEHSAFTLIVPSDLAYGATGDPGKIPENADLIFYIELVKIN